MSASVTDPGRNPPTPSGNWLQPSPAVGSTVSGTCLGFVLESMYLHGFGLPMTVAGQAHRAHTHTHTHRHRPLAESLLLLCPGLPFRACLFFFDFSKRKTENHTATFSRLTFSTREPSPVTEDRRDSSAICPPYFCPTKHRLCPVKSRFAQVAHLLRTLVSVTLVDLFPPPGFQRPTPARHGSREQQLPAPVRATPHRARLDKKR